MSKSTFFAILVATLIQVSAAGDDSDRSPSWGPFRDERAWTLVDAEVKQTFWPAPTDGAIILPGEQVPGSPMPPAEQCLVAEQPLLYQVDPTVQYAANAWRWQVLPSGVIWQSYWAGAHEPRISGTTFAEQDGPWLLDVTLGGRASLLRYGTHGAIRPEGWELQIEGAAIPRLNLDENWDLEATDFRFGVPLVYGRDKLQWKFSYYHLSSHLGDELAIREDNLDERINFSRDALTIGVSFFPLPAWRWYAEAGWAFHFDDGSEPWEFQFGLDLAEPGPTGFQGTPFFAINGHLRQEHNYGGNLSLQTGWLWRGRDLQNVRIGFHYYNGKSNQFEFFDEFEQQIGVGVWYDF